MKDREILKKLCSVVHHDWKKSRELDLSDRGVQLDLEKHSRESGMARVGSVPLDQWVKKAVGE